MKTVRCNNLTYRELMVIKHEQEIKKFDNVNMADVMDVLAWRYNQLKDALSEADEEAYDRIMSVDFVFTDKAEVVAEPILGKSDDDEDEEEMKPKVRKKRTTSKAAAAKRRRKVTDDED